MAIRLDRTETDAQGLPVVSWEEDRNLFAPGGVSPARVTCFIRPGENGVLQFVAAGPMRQGKFEEARPWETLSGFEVSSADKHYRSAMEHVVIKALADQSKSGAGKVLATDGAVVILAKFGDVQRSLSMHLNCADCAPGEADILHDRLRVEFLDRRNTLLHEFCDSDYVWPKDRPFNAFKPQVAKALSPWVLRLVDAVIVLFLLLGLWGLYELLS